MSLYQINILNNSQQENKTKIKTSRNIEGNTNNLPSNFGRKTGLKIPSNCPIKN